MRALILDIGQNKYLRDILGQDILLYQLEWLRAGGCTHISVLTDSIEKNFKYENVNYYACSELPKYEFLKSLLDDKPFVLLNGPFLSDTPLKEITNMYYGARPDVLCLTGGNMRGETFTVERDRSTALLNVFGADEATSNVYIINPLLLSFYFFEQFDIQLFLTEMIKHRRRIFCESNTAWGEYINTYPAYFEASKHLLSAELDATLINDSYYGKNCEIDFSVQQSGRQFFGDDCLVGKNCVLQDSIFLHNVQIGSASRIKNSLLQKNVKIGRHCELENCLIGENCMLEDNVRLPAGSILAAGSILKTGSGVLNV